MNDAADDLDGLLALTDARLDELAQSGAMRLDPYKLSLGILVLVVKVLAVIARRLQPGEMTEDDKQAMRRAMVRAASQQGTGFRKQFRLRTAAALATVIAGAFCLGISAEMARSYVTGAYTPLASVMLPGDAILCQASGLRIDPEGRKFYPPLAMRLETVGRR